jgi:hypothetical protein
MGSNISKKHNRKSRKNNRIKGGISCEDAGLKTTSGWFSKYCAPTEEVAKEVDNNEENGFLPPTLTSTNENENTNYELPPVETTTTEEPPQEPAQEPEIKQEVKPAPTSAKKETLRIKMPNSKAQTLKKYTKKIKEAILENLNKFKSQGITALAILSLEELTAMLQEAIDNYYISELK